METEHEQRGTRRARSGRSRFATVGGLAAMSLLLGVMPTGRANADAAVEPRDEIVASDRIEVLDLGCVGHLRGDVGAIRCRWTVPTHPDAVAVRLVRVAIGSESGRETVFRTDDLSIHSFVDRPVRLGVRYLYAVRAVDADGNVVAASRPASAGVRPEHSDIEALRLNCDQISGIRVSCEWSAPTAHGRVLTLWRSVDGGARERVSSFANPFPTTYVDGVPNGSSKVVYAVIVTDGAGEIVARSRADLVELRPVDSDRRPVDNEPVDIRPVTPTTEVPTSIVPTSPPIVHVDDRSPESVDRPARPEVTAPQTTTPATTVPGRASAETPRPTPPATEQPSDERAAPDTRPTDDQPAQRSPAVDEGRRDRATSSTESTRTRD